MERVPQLPPVHYLPPDPEPAEIADQVGTNMEHGAQSLSRWRPGEDKHEALLELANGFRFWQTYERSFLRWAGPVDWVQVGYDHQAQRAKRLEEGDPEYVGVYPPDPAEWGTHGPTAEVPELPPLPFEEDLDFERWCLEVGEQVEYATFTMRAYEPGDDRTDVLGYHAAAFRALQTWEDFVVKWAGPVDWAALAQERTIRQEIELEQNDPDVSPIFHPDVPGESGTAPTPEATAAPEAPTVREAGRSKPSRGFDFGL